jgi:hypothetical protein
MNRMLVSVKLRGTSVFLARHVGLGRFATLELTVDVCVPLPL